MTVGSSRLPVSTSTRFELLLAKSPSTCSILYHAYKCMLHICVLSTNGQEQLVWVSVQEGKLVPLGKHYSSCDTPQTPGVVTVASVYHKLKCA